MSNIYELWKTNSIARGIAVSVLILVLSVGVVALPQLLDNTGPVQDWDPFSWDTSSGLQLADDIDDRRDSLLMVTMSAHQVTDPPDQVEVTCEPGPCDDDVFGWAGTSYPLLDRNISYFAAYYNQEINDWTLRMDGSQFLNAIFTIEPFLLENITDALVDDVSDIQNLNQKDPETLDLKDLYSVGTVVLHFSLIYNDSSIISVDVVDTTVLLRFERFYKYETSFNMYGVYIDQTYEELNYHGTITDRFPSFVQSLNDIIAIVYGG